MGARRWSIPDALGSLFGGDPARHCEFLRNTANAFVRNKLVTVVETTVPGRMSRRDRSLAEDQLTVLYNAILLHALVPDTAKVCKVFKSRKSREEFAVWASAVLCESDSAMGIALVPDFSRQYVETLRSDADLRQVRLPNPFAVLPQTRVGGDVGLLHALLVRASALSEGDSLLRLYLGGDLAAAYAKAREMSPVGLSPEAASLRQVVIQEGDRAIRDWEEDRKIRATLRFWRDSEPT